MTEYLPAIERLPLPTRTKLRSTQILTSLPQIVSELLQNSLDAQATHIDVGVDFGGWMCWVTDNGHGISKDDLESLAQVGENGRYNTSKTYESSATGVSSTFGFRGEALASAADISCLEICSRAPRSRNTWSIILKGDKLLYKGAAARWKREGAGTTVCVRDAFYNLPVRRLAHTPPSRAWDSIRREIETYSLVFPNVSFTLENLNCTLERTQTKDQIFRIPKTSSTLGAFRHLFGYALIEHVEEIHATDESMTMDGFISLSGAPSKVYQFLYINRHPIAVTDLNRAIEAQFASSSFGKNALDEEGETAMPRSMIRRSPRKSEKKPIYVLNISIAPEEVDNHLDPSKSHVQFRNQSNVINFLSRTFRSFLQKHGFMVRENGGLVRSASPSPSPRKRKKLDFDNFGFAETDAISEMSTLSLQDANQTLETAVSGQLYVSVGGISEEIIWEDPTTGERFVVDSRTGNSDCQTTAQSQKDLCRLTSRSGRRTLRQHETNDMATSSGVAQRPVPVWLERALKSNQAFSIAEKAIPSAASFPPPTQTSFGQDPRLDGKHGCHKKGGYLKLENLEVLCENSIHRFTKDDIRQAQVISQVDRKFIACRFPKRSNGHVSPQENGYTSAQASSVLVLIDQHAADERVRVERFLKELFLGSLNSQDEKGGVRTRVLNPPRPILLTQHEALMIKRSQDDREMLRKWGVGFAELSKVMPDSDSPSESGCSTGYTQLLVSSIPEVVSDKLLQGDELRDFVKGFLGQIQSGDLSLESSNIDSTPEADGEEFFWFKAMRRCPKALLDLVNSKACRGAIMFNDTLSVSQCERLMLQLSKTAFPFQCAHGRPSLVPLVEIEKGQEKRQIGQKDQKNWARLETMVAE